MDKNRINDALKKTKEEISKKNFNSALSILDSLLMSDCNNDNEQRKI